MTREIVVLSGKGGTGKTVVSASLAVRSEPVVVIDADVETPNLAWLLHPARTEYEPFHGGLRIELDAERCDECGLCEESCRFGAIRAGRGADPDRCEGCGLCVRLCPQEALSARPRWMGEILRARLPAGHFVGARLRPGGENSGKLVARVRSIGRGIAFDEGIPLVITDGPPGLGCPALACLSGADFALVVTEPGAAGLADLERLLTVIRSTRVPVGVLINRFDLAPGLAERTDRLCGQNGVPVLGRVPFDPAVPRAVVNGKAPVLSREGPAARVLGELVNDILKRVLKRRTA